MSRARVYKTEAIIIRHQDFGEADKIITLYTPYIGKITAIAKGVRRPKSRMGGHLDLLTRSNLLAAQGKNLDIITQAHLIDSFAPLKAELWRLSCGLYAAELVHRFTPERLPHASLYNLFTVTLERLGKYDKGELVLRFFEMRLLDLMGYRPELRKCSSCSGVIQPGPNYFSSAAGGVVCEECHSARPLPNDRAVSVNAVKVLRVLQGESFETAVCLKLGRELASELDYVLRSFITYILEQEIRSTGWLDTLRRLENTVSPGLSPPGTP
ncbi:MAG: DNA repair protein RecO [Dehalococcoidia bacterium]|nr:DNA repair protein RecO [Dehalococcoidia bacterium]MDZ4247614.1 DNA repair protein RecO [Dehalococcoidia bacterium]